MSDSESVRQVRELAAAVREAHRQSFLRGVRAGLEAAAVTADLSSYRDPERLAKKIRSIKPEEVKE